MALSDSDQTRILDIADEIGELKNELKHLKQSEKAAKDALKESEERFEKWQEDYPSRTKQRLMEHGKNVIAPAAKYYNDLFLSPDGRHRNMRIMAEAATIFDPVMLSKCSDGDGKFSIFELIFVLDVISHSAQSSHTCPNLPTSWWLLNTVISTLDLSID